MSETIILVAVGVLAFALGYIVSWALEIRRRQKAPDPREEILKSYVKKEQLEEVATRLHEKQEEHTRLTADNARQATVIDNLKRQLEEDKEKLQDLQRQFKMEFENLANKIFDEKSKAMTQASAEKLESIIKPFNDKMNEFGKKVEETYVNGAKERSSLATHLENLLQANKQLSEDALRLTQALKGDSQFQGNWGEIQLKRLLEHSGLQEGVHFELQASLRDEDNNLLRPDVLIKLPDDKHLILDSKVSLVAFEKYFNAQTDEEREAALKAHLLSVSNHIKGLSDKNYPALNGINPPDYVLMFLPLEPAFLAAVQADPQLYEKALSKHIALVSPSTLMAVLRTISYIWKNENQTRNAMEIAREGAALYDKFVGFLDDMDQLGKRLDTAQKGYQAAMNKLSESSKKGGTIIGRVQRLKELGANPTKQISQDLLEK